PAYNPYPVTEMIVSIWAGTTGELDDIPVADIRRFEQEFLSHLRHNHKEILDAISENNDLPEDTVEQLKEAVRQYKQSFLAGETRPVTDAPVKPSDADSDNPEKV